MKETLIKKALNNRRISYHVGFVVVLILCTIWGTSALAQTHLLGAAGEFVLPLDDVKDGTKSGGGGSLVWQHRIFPWLHLQTDAGWHQFSARQRGEDLTTKFRVIPVRAGLNYTVGTEDSVRLQVGALAGAYFRHFSIDDKGTDTTWDKTRFGVAPRIGMLIPMGPGQNMLDISVSYDVWFGDKASDLGGLTDQDLDTSYVRMGVGYYWGS